MSKIPSQLRFALFVQLFYAALVISWQLIGFGLVRRAAGRPSVLWRPPPWPSERIRYLGVAANSLCLVAAMLAIVGDVRWRRAAVPS